VEYTDSFLLIAVTAFGLGGISAVGILLVYRGYTRSCAKRRMAKIVPTDVSNNEIVSETMKTSRRSLTSEEIVNQLEQQSKKDQREQEAQLNDRQEKIRSRIAQRLKKRKEAYEERLTNSKILQKIEIFQHLTDTTLARIIHKMELQTFPDGKKICKHGDVSDMFYVIMKGRVQVLIPQQDGLKHTLKEVAILKELQYFGETALLGTKQTRKATCVALDHCEVLALSREQFDHLVQSNLIGAATIVQLENAAATIKKKDEARKLTRLLSTKVSKLSVMQIKRAIIFAQEPDMSEEAKRSAALALAVSIKKYVTSGVREDTEPLSTAIALFVNIQQSLGEETDPKLYDTGKGPKASASRQPSAPPPRGPPPRGPPPQGPPLTEA
jgi:CRP-like cAMP-binding protein